MNKLITLIAIGALAILTPAMAENTSGANWDNDLGVFNSTRDTIVGHSHDFEQYNPSFEVGLGLDVVVYEAKRSETSSLLPDEVTVESRVDFSNQNGSVYAVAKYNLWDRLFGSK